MVYVQPDRSIGAKVNVKAWECMLFAAFRRAFAMVLVQVDSRRRRVDEELLSIRAEVSSLEEKVGMTRPPKLERRVKCM